MAEFQEEVKTPVLRKNPEKSPGPGRVLTVADAIALIVGIVIGAGIFERLPF